MKPLLSIFFLFTFLLFQYGKLIAYMECRIVAAIQSTPDCECETKLQPSTNEGQATTPLHQHTTKNYTEEAFEEISIAIKNPISTAAKTGKAVTAFLLTGFAHQLLQPPRC